MLKSVYKAVFDLIVALGALACILVWLEIRPKDLLRMSFPHAGWLILGIVLFGICLASTGMKLYRQMIGEHKLKDGYETAARSLEAKHSKALADANEQYEKNLGFLRQQIADSQEAYGLERSLREQLEAKTKPPSKLKIHSAYYGTGPIDDRDVADRLRNAVHDGLVLPVDNNTLGCDPAPNNPNKRLRVVYSYQNDAVFETSRPEHSRLILPEEKRA